MMSTSEFLAASYDWHNAHQLKSQMADIQFWCTLMAPNAMVGVFGAGTGRVAIPLAEAVHTVVAIDNDRARLNRIPDHPNIEIMHTSFLDIRETDRFDHVIFPYSTLQLVPPAHLKEVLRTARESLTLGGVLWLDVSNNFERKESFELCTVLADDCPEIGCHLVEKQSGTRQLDHFQIDIQFLAEPYAPIFTSEKWYFHPDSYLRKLFEACSLQVHVFQHGYGAGKSQHRRIYGLKATPKPA